MEFVTKLTKKHRGTNTILPTKNGEAVKIQDKVSNYQKVLATRGNHSRAKQTSNYFSLHPLFILLHQMVVNDLSKILQNRKQITSLGISQGARKHPDT